MQKPQMILFDYGQTLIDERSFNGASGQQALMKHIMANPYHKTAEELQAFAVELNDEIGRFRPETRNQYLYEIHNHAYQSYLYEYWGIEFDISPIEVEKLFWSNAAPGVITEHIDRLLDYLAQNGIRSGVISNISFSGAALTERINRLLPRNRFEFILATSEYVFRKPGRRIFELALKKAGLSPAQAWYCGDNVYCDVEGAAGCGLFPVWYTGASRVHSVPPECEHLQIDDWGQMIGLLGRL